MSIVFRYKPLRGRQVPIITIGISLAGIWYPIEVYVDSGLAYTVLHARIAEGVGFDYRAGELIYLQVGDGSFICMIPSSNSEGRLGVAGLQHGSLTV